MKVAEHAKSSAKKNKKTLAIAFTLVILPKFLLLYAIYDIYLGLKKINLNNNLGDVFALERNLNFSIINSILSIDLLILWIVFFVWLPRLLSQSGSLSELAQPN